MKQTIQEAQQTLIDNGYDADFLPENMAFHFLYDCRKGKHHLTKAFLTLFPDWLYTDDPKNGNLVNSAVESGELDFVQYLVEKGAPINLRDKDGDTPLHTAINWKRREIARYLLKIGANPNNKSKKGYSTLITAIRKGWTEVVDKMLENNVEITANDLLFVLLDAKKDASKVKTFKKLLEYGANPNTKHGDTSMIYLAALHDLGEIVAVLLDAGADTEVKTKAGWTSWMYAKYHNKLKALKVLEEHGAKRHDLSNYGFIEAATEGNLAEVKAWLEKGVSLELKTPSNVTALYRAVSNTQYEVAEYLLDIGANPTIIYDKTNTPLLFAATNKKTDTPTKIRMVKRLLAAGANPNEGEHGSRVFYYAVFNKNYEVAELLYQAGADINSTNKYNEDLLLKAVAKNDTVMFDYLVERGICINGAQGLGKDCKSSPVNYAASQDNLEMVKRLVDLGANLDLKNYLGYTALMRCADRKDGKNRAKIAKTLIEGGADVWILQNTGVPALRIAKWKKGSPVIKAIQEAVTWDKVDYQKLIATMTIKQFNTWLVNGPTIVVKHIIAAGFDINNLKEGDRSPLFIAAHHGLDELFYHLLDIGADPTLTSLAMEAFDENTPIGLKTLKELQTTGKKLTDYLNFYPKGLPPTHFSLTATEEAMAMTWDCLDYKAIANNLTVDDFNVWIEIAPYRVVENILKAGFQLKPINKHQASPLMMAIEADIKQKALTNYPSYTKLMLKHGVDPNIQGTMGNILGSAAPLGTEMMQTLIDAGADVNQWNEGSTPLTSAVYAKSYEGVKFLLDNGANPNPTKAGYNPLYRAVQAQDIKIVQLLLDYGADPNCKVSYEAQTPLGEATKKGLREIAALLSQSTSVNVRDANGRTPLFNACVKGDLAQIKVLLEKRASTKILDYDGNSLESFARLRPDVADLIGVSYQRLSIQNLVGKLSPTLEYLLKHHELPTNRAIDITEKDYRGDTLLHYAVTFDNLKAVQQLIDLEADPYAKNKLGETPILKAVAIGNDEIKTFFNNKKIAPINNKPLEAVNNQAAMYGRIEDFETIIKEGDLNAVNTLLDDYQVNIHQLRARTTPLTLAIRHRDIEMMELLLRKGANVEISSIPNLSPLFLAISKKDNQAVIQTLLRYGADATRHKRMLLNALLANKFSVLESLYLAGARFYDVGYTVFIDAIQFDAILELTKKYQDLYAGDTRIKFDVKENSF